MSILILGDPHIGKGVSIGRSGVGTALNTRIVDQLNILDWVLDEAIQRSIKQIVITGDVFDDPKPPHQLISIFLEWLKRCVANNVEVHIIMGNHDMLRSGQFYISPLDIVSASEINNVFVHNKINTLHFEDVSITFLPFRDRRSFNFDKHSLAIDLIRNQLLFEVAEIPRGNLKVVVGHLALENSIPVGYELDDLMNELFCPIDIFQDYDYVWMGHVHKFQVLSQKPYCAHTGSMDISDFGECNQKKYITIIDSKLEQHFKYIEIPTRPLYQIEIDVPENVENIMEFVIEQITTHSATLNHAIVKVNIILNSTHTNIINRTVIENKLYEFGAFHIVKIAETRKLATIKKSINKIDNTISEISAINMFAESVDEYMRDDFITAAANIIKEYHSS